MTQLIRIGIYIFVGYFVGNVIYYKFFHQDDECTQVCCDIVAGKACIVEMGIMVDGKCSASCEWSEVPSRYQGRPL